MIWKNSLMAFSRKISKKTKDLLVEDGNRLSSKENEELV
jgi:hypothetical protein